MYSGYYDDYDDYIDHNASPEYHYDNYSDDNSDRAHSHMHGLSSMFAGMSLNTQQNFGYDQRGSLRNKKRGGVRGGGSPKIGGKGGRGGPKGKRTRSAKKKNKEKGSDQRNNRKKLCSSCKKEPCRCRCHNYRCGKLFKNCQCERRHYGFYRCRSCGHGWQSAYTYVRGGGKYAQALYGQQCKNCKNGDRRYHLAYKWRKLICSVCKKSPCAQTEECEERHVDLRKNHEQSLCKKCWNKPQPCSFGSRKYKY